MTDSLATYLDDHLAGSTLAIELIESLRDREGHTPLGEFATQLLADVSQDRETLENLIHRVGSDVPVLKGTAAWAGEKVSRLKVGRVGEGLGTFEALETLALGILGKRALWQALPTIAEVDHRVAGVDFNQLAARAEVQYAAVEAFRLKMVRIAFARIQDSRH